MLALVHIILFTIQWFFPVWLVCFVASLILSRRLRSAYLSNPYCPFKKWTWTDLPSEWSRTLKFTSTYCILFAGVAVFLIMRLRGQEASNPPWGLEGVAIFMSVSFGLTSFRILQRVRTTRIRSENS
jgi:hypothetical protein